MIEQTPARIGDRHVDPASALKHDLAEVPCPLCNGRDLVLYVNAPSHYGPEKLRVTRCRACRMIFTNPQSASYESRVRERGVLDRFFNPDRIAKARMLSSLHLSDRGSGGSGKRILDFGCGEGAFVRQAQHEGWDAMGVDLNDALVRAANEYWKFDSLHSKDLGDLLREGRRFDAIYTNQVFEHLRRPVELGQTLTNLLVPGGLIYIEVPNASRFHEVLHRGGMLDPTSHFNHFTTHTLKQLAHRIGCTPIYASGAPGMFTLWRRLGVGRGVIPLAKFSRRILPNVGAGACVVARKV